MTIFTTYLLRDPTPQVEDIAKDIQAKYHDYASLKPLHQFSHQINKLEEHEEYPLNFGLLSLDDKIEEGNISLCGIFTISYESSVGFYKYTKIYVGCFGQAEFKSGKFEVENVRDDKIRNK
jgi:hypothetical protein